MNSDEGAFHGYWVGELEFSKPLDPADVDEAKLELEPNEFVTGVECFLDDSENATVRSIVILYRSRFCQMTRYCRCPGC
jgi:hypothetical protein